MITQTMSKGISLFIASVFLILFIYFLAPILTPFLLGALVAYLTDPLVKKLEKGRIPHLASVLIILFAFALVIALLFLSLIPTIEQQIVLFVQTIPAIVAWMQDKLLPHLTDIVNVPAIKSGLTSALPKAGSIVNSVVHSGYTVIQWMTNIVLTPVVTFYLLRDWDKVVTELRSFLPKNIKPTIIKLSQEYDEVLSAFFRGQLMIMLTLSVIYSVGLKIVGLQLACMIGIIGGLLSIIPYFGSIFVVVSATIAALVQFGTWGSLIGVWVVFLIGQTIEGYVLTPYLIGERIGLHPVAVIFAIMAGGTLFGFVGILLALPVAALLMIVLRHLQR